MSTCEFFFSFFEDTGKIYWEREAQSSATLRNKGFNYSFMQRATGQEKAESWAQQTFVSHLLCLNLKIMTLLMTPAQPTLGVTWAASLLELTPLPRLYSYLPVLPPSKLYFNESATFGGIVQNIPIGHLYDFFPSPLLENCATG